MSCQARRKCLYRGQAQRWPKTLLKLIVDASPRHGGTEVHQSVTLHPRTQLARRIQSGDIGLQRMPRNRLEHQLGHRFTFLESSSAKRSRTFVRSNPLPSAPDAEANPDNVLAKLNQPTRWQLHDHPSQAHQAPNGLHPGRCNWRKEDPLGTHLSPLPLAECRAFASWFAHQSRSALLSTHRTTGARPLACGGVRKIRWAMPRRGKRSGSRVIYYWLAMEDHIYLHTLYAKAVKDDLTAAERAAWRRAVAAIDNE